MIINGKYIVRQNLATLQLSVRGPGLWVRESCNRLISKQELESWGRRVIADVEQALK